MKECEFRNERGCCTKWHANRKCKNDISNLGWFDDIPSFGVCEVEDVCRLSSIFGNRYMKITKEDIEALQNGKVLNYVDEYGMFIILEGG